MTAKTINKLTAPDTAVLDTVKVNAEKSMREAFSVLAGIKSGKLPLAKATEMSNALGKANAAMGNMLKAELLCLALDRQNMNFAHKQKPMLTRA